MIVKFKMNFIGAMVPTITAAGVLAFNTWRSETINENRGDFENSIIIAAANKMYTQVDVS